MLVSSVPYKFTVPWANSASGSFITKPVPAVSTGPAAGQDLGFPPATALPEGSGGTPPNINDINGALYYATAWEQWIQAGAPIVYDATFQTAIGGYPKGAIVPSAATPYLRWISTVDNNTSDPDTGGANWLAMSGRLIGGKPTLFTASGTWTPNILTATALFGVQGAGGGGGGATLPSVGNVSLGSPGGSGAWALGFFAAATFGSSQTITVGTGGASATGGNGSAGGTSSVGSLVVCAGGIAGGMLNDQAAPVFNGNGSSTAAPTGGNIESSEGSGGAPSTAMSAASPGMITGMGGSSRFGAGAPQIAGNGGTPPAAVNRGSGGGGSCINNGYGGSASGSAGANGAVWVWEYSI
jgi:hypothetical protein